MSTHNLRKYKESKAVLPHLELILRIFNLTETSLKYFSAYIPVAKVLIVLREQKLVIEAYKAAHKSVKDNKGKINE